jgi:hypothetical protein
MKNQVKNNLLVEIEDQVLRLEKNVAKKVGSLNKIKSNYEALNKQVLQKLDIAISEIDEAIEGIDNKQ